MRRSVFVLLAGITLGYVPPAFAQDFAPISLLPANPHYFLWRDRPTILITSGEHYGAVLNLDFDYVRYLDELHAHGLNHTRTFSGVYREIPASFNITDNTLAPKSLRYIGPWARSGTAGYFDGGNKFDLTKWDDEYFARLKDFLREAQARGIVVELNLFCPMYNDDLWKACPMNAANNVNGVGDCPREEVYALKHEELTRAQLAVTRKIVGELRGFDNLYYEVCNEPYFGGVTMAWQRRIVDEIQEVEKGFPRKHLISLNIANGRAKVENPHPGVSIFNFHYCVPPDVVAMNYGLNKVIGENETGFRGSADVLYRTEAWDFLLAGGGLYNNLDYSFTPGHPGGTLRDYESPGGGSVELRQQLRILKEFIEGFDFPPMKPDDSAVTKTEPELAYKVLAEPGKAYAIYIHVPIPEKPEALPDPSKQTAAELALQLPAGRYSFGWLDPVTGESTLGELLSHGGGPLSLSTPRFGADLALRITAVESEE